MAASVLGIITLLFICAIGPIVWGLVLFKRKKNGTQTVREETEREESTPLEFLMAMLGYAIGIGNLWRFPYLVGKFGGGAFVVAYLVCLVFVSAPAYLLEMTMGHYCQKNTINCMKSIHPIWVGLGWMQAVMLFFILGYYNVLLGYSIVFIMGSLVEPFPWKDNAGAYWNVDILNRFDSYEGLSSLGGLSYQLVLAMIGVYVIVFFSLVFGKEILGRITWVTVLAPVCMLFILLIQALTLDGAGDGLEFYLGKFDGEVLSDIDMWATACSQILFSLSPGCGTAITLSGGTKKKADVFKTCAITSFCNSAFSLIGGLAIFSIVGNIAYEKNLVNPGSTTVAAEARAGPGLAFIAIASGMETFGSGKNLMAVLFFMTLLTLGLDSTYAWMETFITYVEDSVAASGRKMPKWQIKLAVCLVLLGCGLPYCSRFGNELLDVVDHYIAVYVLLIGVAVEAFMFLIHFGWRRAEIALQSATIGQPDPKFGIKDANGRILPAPLKAFLVFCIGARDVSGGIMPGVMPIMGIFLTLYVFQNDVTEAYEGYPDWAQGIGWFLLLICLGAVPVGAYLGVKSGAGSTLAPLAEEEERLRKELGDSSGTAADANIMPKSTQNEAEPVP